jgi:hypothetical protein
VVQRDLCCVVVFFLRTLLLCFEVYRKMEKKKVKEKEKGREKTEMRVRDKDERNEKR